jgi:hypothetical protein
LRAHRLKSSGSAKGIEQHTSNSGWQRISVQLRTQTKEHMDVTALLLSRQLRLRCHCKSAAKSCWSTQHAAYRKCLLDPTTVVPAACTCCDGAVDRDSVATYQCRRDATIAATPSPACSQTSSTRSNSRDDEESLRTGTHRSRVVPGAKITRAEEGRCLLGRMRPMLRGVDSKAVVEATA